MVFFYHYSFLFVSFHPCAKRPCQSSIQYFKMTSFVSCLSLDFWTSNFFSCACGCCSCVKLCFFHVISLMFFALSSPLKNFSSFSLHCSSFSVSVGLALYNFIVGIFVEFELWERVHLFCPRQCFLHSYVIAT